MQIHWAHIDSLTTEQRESIEQRLQNLAGDHADLIDVRIMGKPSNHHRRGGQEVRIACQARNREIVAARTRPVLEAALDEALDAFEREVHRMRDRRTRQRVERPAEPAELGIVDAVFGDEGYGFILTDAGERVYFHRNAVRGGLSFEALAEGDRVGLDFEAGDKGLQATVVVQPPPDATAP